MRNPNINILERFKCMSDGSRQHAGFVIEFGKQHLIGLDSSQLIELRDYISSVIKEDLKGEEACHGRS